MKRILKVFFMILVKLASMPQKLQLPYCNILKILETSGWKNKAWKAMVGEGWWPGKWLISILTELAVKLKGITAFWPWYEFFIFQLRKHGIWFLLCRQNWAQAFVSSESSMQALLRWEGAGEMWSGPRSSCCCTAALVSPAHSAQNFSLSVTTAKWLGCSWQQRGMQTLWVNQKKTFLFWVKKKNK